MGVTTGAGNKQALGNFITFIDEEPENLGEKLNVPLVV